MNFICLQYGKEEWNPMEVVENFVFLDGWDPSELPKFNCEKCDGDMIPE